MPSEAQMKAVMARYVERINAADAAGIVELFAEDATVEDPVGTPVVRGRAALAAFYEDAVSRDLSLRILSGPHGSFGDSAAMAAEIMATPPGRERCRIRLVEIQTFDEQCRITSMRAFWGKEDMSPA